MKSLIISLGLISLFTIGCSSQSLPSTPKGSVKADRDSNDGFGSDSQDDGFDSANSDGFEGNSEDGTFGGSSGNANSENGGSSSNGNGGSNGNANRQCGPILDDIVSRLPSQIKDEMVNSMDVRCAIENGDASEIRRSIMALPTCQQYGGRCDSKLLRS